MAQIDPPKPNPLIEWMAKLLKEKAPGVVEAAGKVAEYPPVKLAGNLMNAGDPMGVMGIGLPLQAFDAWGKAVKVSADTGKPLAKTAKDISQMTAQAEMAAQLARKAEAATGGIQSVAFRNVGTGEIIKGGRTHPSSHHLLPADSVLETPGSRLPAIRPPEKRWVEGFLDAEGKFLDRKEAAKAVGYEQNEFMKELGVQPSLDAGSPRSGLRKVVELDSDDLHPWHPTQRE